MDYAEQRFSSRKAGGIAFVALLHVGIIYALVTGLGDQVAHVLRQPLEAKKRRTAKASAGGHAFLDEAAVAALSQCKSRPAIGADGKPQEAWTSTRYVWQLDPNPQTWSASISLIAASPGVPDSLTRDVYRLRFATGTLTQPADYEDYTERAIPAGDNTEANAVIGEGFTFGVLTGNTDSGHVARLKTLTLKNSLASPQMPVGLIQQAKTGGSQLDLGIAELNAGSTAQAIEIFQTIQTKPADSSSSPEAALASLWEIRAQNVAR